MNYIECQAKAYEYLAHCQYSEAEILYRQCIEQNPDDLNNYGYLGLVLLLQNSAEEAEAVWLSVFLEEIIPENEPRLQELTDLLIQQALKYQECGYLKPATTIYWYILQQDPESPQYNHLLGTVLAHQGQFEPAIALYYKALTLQANYAEAYFSLGQVLLEKEEFILAYKNFSQAIILEPDNLLYRQWFAISLDHIVFTSIDPEILRQVERCFDFPEVGKQNLAGVSLSILKLDQDFERVLKMSNNHKITDLELEYDQGKINKIIGNRLFHKLLQETLLSNLEIEVFLTQIRKIVFLKKLQKWSDLDPHEFNFLCSLGIQCFNNEYIFNITQDEQNNINFLKTIIENQLRDRSPIKRTLKNQLILLSLYCPLYSLAGYERLLEIEAHQWESPLNLLIKRSLQDYQEEQKIKTTIISLTETKNEISLAVKSQYEDNPYPRWLQMSKLDPKPISAIMGHKFPHFELPNHLINQPLKILDAGCGTGRSSISLAMTYKFANILAVDISFSSLAYGIRMAREMNLNNIVFRQADILNFPHVNQHFNLIFSTGVLHHLDNPIEGLKVLFDLLEPLGLINIALYSQKARRSIEEARRLIEREGISSNPESIREFRAKMLTSCLDFPQELMNSSDYFTMSSCRDLIFHVNEHCFTLPQIKTILEDFGLRFMGLDLGYKVKDNYQKMFPEDVRMNNLLLWDQFEDIYPSTFFIGMYDLWCQKI